MHSSRIQKASRRAAIATLIGFVLVLSAVAYSALTLSSNLDKLEEQRQELITLQEGVESLRTQRAELEAQLASLRADIEYASAQVEQKNIEGARNALAQSIENMPEKQVQPRVYIHFRSKEQARSYGKMTEALLREGFQVPLPEILVQKGPSGNQVRYFKADERAEAERVLSTVKDLYPGNWSLNFLGEYEKSTAIRPRHYEIWMGPASN